MKCWNKVVVMFVIGMLVFACGCGDTKEEAEEVTQAAGEERDMKENIPESIPENISEDANLITVQYSEKAEFTVQTTTDGLTSTEREGSKEELKKDSSVILTGSWDGEIFRADKIVIFVVDM